MNYKKKVFSLLVRVRKKIIFQPTMEITLKNDFSNFEISNVFEKRNKKPEFGLKMKELIF